MTDQDSNPQRAADHAIAAGNQVGRQLSGQQKPARAKARKRKLHK
jgi:hypothetical protein